MCCYLYTRSSKKDVRQGNVFFLAREINQTAAQYAHVPSHDPRFILHVWSCVAAAEAAASRTTTAPPPSAIIMVAARLHATPALHPQTRSFVPFVRLWLRSQRRKGNANAAARTHEVGARLRARRREAGRHPPAAPPHDHMCPPPSVRWPTPAGRARRVARAGVVVSRVHDPIGARGRAHVSVRAAAGRAGSACVGAQPSAAEAGATTTHRRYRGGDDWQGARLINAIMPSIWHPRCAYSGEYVLFLFFFSCRNVCVRVDVGFVCFFPWVTF